jgi:hypothetical protein
MIVGGHVALIGMKETANRILVGNAKRKEANKSAFAYTLINPELGKNIWGILQ